MADFFNLDPNGTVQIGYVEELTLPTSVRWMLEGVEREAAQACAEWMQPHYQNADGYLLQSIHTIVVRTPEQLILVDTGVGNGKDRGGGIPAFNQLATDFLDRLAAAGVAPCARICTRTTSVGTPTSRTGAGCRRSRTRVTYSWTPSGLTGMRSPVRPRRRRVFSRTRSPRSPRPGSWTSCLPTSSSMTTSAWSPRTATARDTSPSRSWREVGRRR